jgi:2-acylglycerol O-acyltransferase 2
MAVAWSHLGLYVAFVLGLLQVLSFIERRAAMRGSNGAPMPVVLDKGLRALFLVAWTLPMLTVLPVWVCCLWFVAYGITFLDGSEQNGSRESPFVKSFGFWNVIKRRLHIVLRPTVDLPKGKYVVAIAPHGILPFGSMFAFFSNVANVKNVLPNLNMRCLAASFCFYIPIYRDILLAAGVCDAARYNARYLLDHDYSLALVPGGATEALYAGVGKHTLYINKRLGFVRLAMQTKSQIIPVYGFGENDTWETVEVSSAFVTAFRARWQRIFGISLPFVAHIFPRRTKVNVVLGAPVTVPHIENPTDDECRAALEVYKKALSELWHAHKDEYARERTQDLTFL